MGKWIAVFLLASFLLPALAFGQAYTGTSCAGAGNAQLKSLKVGVSAGTLDQSLTGAFSAWATSTLQVSGKPPAPQVPEGDDSLNEAAWQRDEWSCGYSAARAFDGKIETAWCEGVAGAGIGEVVVVPIEPSRPTAIWAGFGKSEALFAMNARPRKVKLWVLQARHSLAHQYGTTHTEIQVLAEGETTLADKNDFQDLPLPKFTPLPEGSATFLAIQILSVYPGKKYQDTCISEVANPEG